MLVLSSKRARVRVAPASLPIREAWLLDGEGRMVVRSSERSATTAPVPFPDAFVVDRARAGEAASFRRDDGEWVMLWPLRTLGWSWLVEAPESALAGR